MSGDRRRIGETEGSDTPLGGAEPLESAQLLLVVYDELRKLETSRLRQERPGQTLQATALVHEDDLRMVGPEGGPRWANRAHFFAAAAEAMRRILVEEARRKQSLRRGGALDRQDPEGAEIAAPGGVDVLELNDALDRLSARDPEAAELVKLRFFAGMTMEEAARALNLSERTAERTWVYARSFLRTAMGPMGE